MTREEEIEQQAKSLYYHFCVRETCEGEDDCINCPYGKVIEPLVSMAKWADQHPRKGLWDAEKVIKWLEENTIERLSRNFVEKLCKAIEE